MSPAPKKVIAAYVPVIHRGYLNFLESNSSASELYIFGPQLIKKIDYLRKDLRALQPKEVVDILTSLTSFTKVSELTLAGLKQLDVKGQEIVMPDEDVSREVAKSLKNARVIFYPVFLRWDRQSVNKGYGSAKVSTSKKDMQMMKRAVTASRQSSDIWRRVGAVLVALNGKVLGTAYNQAEPNEHSPWIEGDPRNVFNRGVGIEMSVFTHAEAALVAQAAKIGNKTEGATMYVTVFPCPACAKLIAKSGIKKLYYKDGYAVLDGIRVLGDYEVQVLRVKVSGFKETGAEGDVPYKPPV